MKPLRIALLGFGTVGGGVYQIISQRSADLAKQSGRVLEIKRILVQDLTKTRGLRYLRIS